MIEIAVLAVVAALFIVVFRRRPETPPKGNWIVVDGSNVLYWDGDTPDLASVGHVLAILKSEGYDPLVWFDANVGYLIGDRWLGPGPLSERLGMSREHVFVAEKGTPADPLLLERAERLGARVVTNDKYRDWVERFPRVQEEGFLVRGFISRDEVGLEWER